MRRQESSAISTSTSQSREADVFDTAPPSDLDIRFPALLPQPSPLNSRRRGTAQDDGENRGEEAFGVDGTGGDLSEADQHPDETMSALAEVRLPDFDSRWKETKELVDSYMQNLHRRSSTALVESHHRFTIPMNESAIPVATQPVHEPNGDIADGSGIGGAVMNRLEAVTDEVQALREQVAELSNMLVRNLAGESGFGSSARHVDDGERRQLEDSHRAGQRNSSQIEKPIYTFLAHLDSLVHERYEPGDTNGATPRQVPDEVAIARICEPINLEILQSRIEEWERMARRRK
ncbi:hypothetical protein NCC49_003309 [Naganishia albida]|nr:hypothetical protein NCC49_003309 [Naganishia albida]